ncbi:hypothetical protein BDZ97DRAFT_1918615 [Flammula alnicola]|nr:hypothetical protein BDZ97DRAFT_1918615 [Flammula alnicola]
MHPFIFEIDLNIYVTEIFDLYDVLSQAAHGDQGPVKRPSKELIQQHEHLHHIHGTIAGQSASIPRVPKFILSNIIDELPQVSSKFFYTASLVLHFVPPFFSHTHFHRFLTGEHVALRLDPYGSAMFALRR